MHAYTVTQNNCRGYFFDSDHGHTNAAHGIPVLIVSLRRDRACSQSKVTSSQLVRTF